MSVKLAGQPDGRTIKIRFMEALLKTNCLSKIFPSSGRNIPPISVALIDLFMEKLLVQLSTCQANFSHVKFYLQTSVKDLTTHGKYDPQEWTCYLFPYNGRNN